MGLFLTDSITYINSTISENWLKLHVPVVSISIDCKSIVTIEANGFSDFKELIYLKMFNVKQYTFLYGALNGLNALTSINFITSEQPYYSASLLPDSPNLKQLYISSTTDNLVYTIESLTTFINKKTIKDIGFYLNVRNTLTELVLVGYKSLETLNLQNCEIEIIHTYAFYPVRNTLRQLYLNGNKLKQLPNTMIGYLMPNRQLSLFLESNSWHCDCKLTNLRLFLLRSTTNYYSSALCMSPSNFNGIYIVNADICNDLEFPMMELECSEWNGFEGFTVNISDKSIFSNVSRELNTGTVSLNVSPPNQDYYVLWFNKTKQFIDELKCHKNFDAALQLLNLSNHTAYMFCLINRYSQTITPFHCISFYQNAVLETVVWLTDDDTCLTIIYIALLLIIAILIGLSMGYIVFYNYPELLCNPSIIMQATKINSACVNQFKERYLKHISLLLSIIIEFFSVNTVMVYLDLKLYEDN